jgi:hypothetical protein
VMSVRMEAASRSMVFSAAERTSIDSQWTMLIVDNALGDAIG